MNRAAELGITTREFGSYLQIVDTPLAIAAGCLVTIHIRKRLHA